MRIDWVMPIAAVAVFLVVLAIQWFVRTQVTVTNVRRYWNDSAGDSSKLIRQDVGGIIVAIGITNALLRQYATVIVIQARQPLRAIYIAGNVAKLSGDVALS